MESKQFSCTTCHGLLDKKKRESILSQQAYLQGKGWKTIPKIYKARKCYTYTRTKYYTCTNRKQLVTGNKDTYATMNDWIRFSENPYKRTYYSQVMWFMLSCVGLWIWFKDHHLRWEEEIMNIFWWKINSASQSIRRKEKKLNITILKPIFPTYSCI